MLWNSWSSGFSRFRERVGDFSRKLGHAIFMGSDIFGKQKAATVSQNTMVGDGLAVFTRPLQASDTSQGDGAEPVVDVVGKSPSPTGQPDPSGGQKGRWTRFVDAVFRAKPGEHQWATATTITFGVTELALLASGVAFLTGAGIELIDPSANPVFNKPTGWQVTKLAMNCTMVGALLYGINGFPKKIQPYLRKTIGRGLARLGMPQGIIDNGHALGNSARINAMHPKEGYEGRLLLGQHPKAFGKMLLWDQVINVPIFTGVALALDIPFQAMLPAFLLNIAASTGTARVTSVLERAKNAFGKILMARTAFFATANALTPLATYLKQDNILSMWEGFGFQMGYMGILLGAAFALTRNIKERPELSTPDDRSDA